MVLPLGGSPHLPHRPPPPAPMYDLNMADYRIHNKIVSEMIPKENTCIKTYYTDFTVQKEENYYSARRKDFYIEISRDRSFLS